MISSTHTHFQARALRARALKALTATSRSFCAKGYSGPLCAVCAKGYYLSKIVDQCLSCQGRAGGEQLALLIIVPLIMLILGIIASVFRLRSVYKKLQDSSGESEKNRTSTDAFAEQAPVVRTYASYVISFPLCTFPFRLLSNSILLYLTPFPLSAQILAPLLLLLLPLGVRQ